MTHLQGSVEEGDLAHAHAEVVSRLQTQIQELKEELGDKVGASQRPQEWGTVLLTALLYISRIGKPYVTVFFAVILS